MIKSMTGYSYREFIYNNRKFVINIKSLNSRFLDIKINLPKEISNAESEIQNIISENIQRGKIEFEIFIENMNNNDLLKIDYSILEEYFNLISDICDRYKIQKNITICCRSRGIFPATEHSNQYFDLDSITEVGSFLSSNYMYVHYFSVLKVSTIAWHCFLDFPSAIILNIGSVLEGRKCTQPPLNASCFTKSMRMPSSVLMTSPAYCSFIFWAIVTGSNPLPIFIVSLCI